MTDLNPSRTGFKRVMLKLGGEMFGGGKVGIDPDVVESVARQIADVARAGTEVAVVIGAAEEVAAAQRALEIGCEVLLMAKGVDGVYDSDPRENPDAKLYSEISPREVIENGLKVADATAFSLCMDNNMPILVFNLLQEGNIARAVSGEQVGTLVA